MTQSQSSKRTTEVSKEPTSQFSKVKKWRLILNVVEHLVTITGNGNLP